MSSKNGIPNHLFFILILSFLVFEVTEISAQFMDFSSSSAPSSESYLGEQRINVISENHMNQQDDTVRIDPLDNFNKYIGGFDITNKHYWSSTVFAGVYGYALGALWLVCGIVFGGIYLVKLLRFKHKKSEVLKKKRSRCHYQCHLLPILTAIFFTLLAIVASGVVIGGNARFHSEAKDIVDIIIETANEASKTIYSTTGAMKDIRDNIGASNGSIEAQEFLNNKSHQLDNEATKLHSQAKKNRHKVDNGLKTVFIVSTLINSMNLVAVIALSVCGILRLRRALRMLIILCWFMIVLCWLFFGIYFFLDRFAGDTCTALEEFQRNPYNNSLSSILPCDELLSAKAVLHDLSAGIHNLVNEVNINISLRQPSIPVSICNPFSEPPRYVYQPENCPSTSIRIGDIPQVLKIFTCSNNTTCGSSGFSISSEDYKAAESYSSSIQSLLNVYPGMESLVECQSVKNAFSDILAEHCKPLKKFVHMVWTSMAFLSLIMVILVVLWTIKDFHEDSLHSSDSNVVIELGTEKEDKDYQNSLV